MEHKYNIGMIKIAIALVLVTLSQCMVPVEYPATSTTTYSSKDGKTTTTVNRPQVTVRPTLFNVTPGVYYPTYYTSYYSSLDCITARSQAMYRYYNCRYGYRSYRCP